MNNPLTPNQERKYAARSSGDAHSPAPDSKAVPLCVGLDGTLLRTDLLGECILAVAGKWRWLSRLPRLLVKGGAGLRQGVTELAVLDPALLPYNEKLLNFLHEQRAAGRRLALAAGPNTRPAHTIADHLGLFDEVICSDGIGHLKGEAMAAALVERFGRGGFAYAGNDLSDLPVWRQARSIVLVNVRPATREKARAGALVEAEFNDQHSVFGPVLQAMRPHQWVKNLLVFVPMVMAHAVGNLSAWIGGLSIFAAFCVTASGIYIINDLTDLAADRRHPRKRYRPFASGVLSIASGIRLAAMLVALGFGISAAIGVPWLIVTYAAVSMAYSVALKEFPLVDVFVLAGLYALRILAGGLATGHQASLWLLGFSGFLFLSLALVKRTEEMMAVARSSRDRRAARRGYRPDDVMILQMFGCASAFASSVVLALFVGSTAASVQYRSPELLWGIVPLILFWQCRLWLSTARGHMQDDPIVYATRDWVSWIVAACVLALLIAATYGPVSLTSEVAP